MSNFWTSWSLRTMVTLMLVAAVAPILLSVGIGYQVLRTTIVADFSDVYLRHREQVMPLQGLQLSLLRAEVLLEQYVIDGEPSSLARFQDVSEDVDDGFPRLAANVVRDPYLAARVRDAAATWAAMRTEAREVIEMLATGDRGAALGALQRFDELEQVGQDSLTAVFMDVEASVESDYRDAMSGWRTTELVTLIATGVSLILLVTGALLFSRIILRSVDRLVAGANRLSVGDRDHEIQIQVPPEFRQVAEAMNRMTSAVRASEDRLLHLAQTDQLTGLLNRTTYDSVLSEGMERWARYDEPFALLVLDLDHFKRINDDYGHDAGDTVLKHVAGTLRRSVRGIDRVFRTGGEEFSVVLPQTDAPAAHVTAERIREQVARQRIRVGDRELAVTVSVGFDTVEAVENSPESMRKRADIALYRAKELGRNRVCAFEGDA